MINVNGKMINNFAKPFIIAEIGANHNGDMDLAKKLIDVAVECGVDAVKFQSWTTQSLISKQEFEKNQVYNDSPKKHFGSLKEMVEKYYLREDQHLLLKNYCDSKKIVFCSTPFSEQEVDFLDKLNVPFFKIASMDINNFRLLKHASIKGKPILLSTGMASLGEIDAAVDVIKSTGNNQVILLHCISIYPPKYEDIHLNNIVMLQKTYPDYPIGFSDHTIGTAIPIASIALGTALVEKHFTLDKDLPGWDHEISADPDELKHIVSEGNNVWKSLGNFNRVVSNDEKSKKEKFRRSIVVTKNMKKGETITESDICFKRPGTHISPNEEKYVIGRKLNKDVKSDTLLNWSDFE